MSKDPINRINPEQVEPSKSAGPTPSTTPPDKGAFQSQMQGAGTPQAGAQQKGVTPMELTENPQAMQTQGPSMQSVVGQINTTQSNIADIKNNLQNNPNLKFKRSQEYLMRNKLTDAQEHIQSASNKVGAPVVPPKQIAAGEGPVGKFIGMVSDGENQLAAAQQKLEDLQKEGKTLNPADLMIIQVKLSQAQQELNYTSILLSKVVESFKQMMNIQL